MRSDLVERAHEIADAVLFPAALAVDRTGHVPESHGEALADAGLYGIAAPSDAGGPGLDLPQIIMANQNFGSRLSATLPIGLVGRCTPLLDEAGEIAAAAALREEADGCELAMLSDTTW
ncbi:acyl-CoA dehydrogenase family protein [Mycolicibacterium sarraceniae]|uniref:Acyl-CoA dehydrogenase/oxidase N-terminal domain-containing protein n=1 Tax=Mycolicibacterium sarraceniae TaxID=1534348 RepID=A0A7I7SR67_9MYCO|nr:hypothetical protein MSAR_26180 [Mycolicibacterium sarraceniae]